MEAYQRYVESVAMSNTGRDYNRAPGQRNLSFTSIQGSTHTQPQLLRSQSDTEGASTSNLTSFATSTATIRDMGAAFAMGYLLGALRSTKDGASTDAPFGLEKC